MDIVYFNKETIKTLLEIDFILKRNSNESNFEEIELCLKSLQTLIDYTIKHNFNERDLKIHNDFWYQIIDILKNIDWVNTKNSEILSLKIRIYKGVLILLRNCVIRKIDNFDYFHLVKNLYYSYNNLIEINLIKKNNFFEQIFLIYFQIFFNFMNCEQNEKIAFFFKQMLYKLINKNDYENCIIDVLFMVRNLNSFLNVIFEENCHILNFLAKKFDNINIEDPLSEFNNKVFFILTNVIVNSEFEKWLSNLKNEEQKLNLWLTLVRKIFVMNDFWSENNLKVFLELVYNFLTDFENIFVNSLKNCSNNFLKNIFILLDIISYLFKYNSSKKYFLEKNLIKSLINLLKVTNENSITLNLKSSLQKKKEVEKLFGFKSLLVELITYLTFESFETQEEIRKLHGIELILSNCIIDQNNPFIKERCILCLKYLLKNNPENQKFIEQIEKKKN